MPSINFKHLHYFWVVAKEGSIARASEILHLTPQTISGQLRLLEESMGVALLEKAGRGLALTEAGRVALSYADDIFLLGAELREVMRHGGERPRQFSVGIPDVIPKLVAYRLLEPALSLPDATRIVCQENKLEDLLADLAVHKLDMVLADSSMAASVNVRAFNHLLGECGVTFFGVPGLAARFRKGFPRSLHNAPLLLPTAGSALRSKLTQWFSELEIDPHVAGEFTDSALMQAFGQAGVGLFSAPSAIENEIVTQHKVTVVGRTDQIREQFYAISLERKLKHPAIVAIRDAASRSLF
ncbi:MAG TPA: transcriptional activator NhaR [Gammaproteobacteria bacterium]|nr:transcriptional activator NhaR [Gammaproteobacteria bacterium]